MSKGSVQLLMHEIRLEVKRSKLLDGMDLPGKGKARQGKAMQGKGNKNKSTKKLCMEQAFPTPRQRGNLKRLKYFTLLMG